MDMKLRNILIAVASAALIAPAGAIATDGDHDGDRDGKRHHHRHHHGVLLAGTVTSVNDGDDLLGVRIAKSSRGGRGLVGETVTVKVVRLWAADTNDDDKRTVGDVRDGDRVLIKTKRRFISDENDRISAAKVIDLTHWREWWERHKRDHDGDRD
jgi:hypothetical protein